MEPDATGADAPPSAPREAGEWPPPHPSPPLPPPREYGSPGTPASRTAWVWAVVGAVVMGVVISAGLAYIVSGIGGDDDSTASASEPAPDSAAVESSAPPAPSPAPEEPAKVTCWDGTGAQVISQCTAPEGVEGLSWVFPLLPQQRCSSPQQPGDGVVLRVLCSAKTQAGVKVTLGYYQWETVAAGQAYYEDQGLDRTEAGGVYQYTDANGEVSKIAGLYINEPYSITLTMPPGTVVDDTVVASRPPDQLRGQPVG